MQNSRSGENKTSAIIRFFIGLCALMIFIFVLYYLAAVRDWSYLAGNSALLNDSRTAAANEASPFDTPAAVPPSAQPADTAVAALVSVAPTPVKTESPAMEAVNQTPSTAATRAVMFAPTSTPTPRPTPVPTKIPAADLSASKKGFNMPAEGTNGQIGISRCYVSIPDSYQIIMLEGWGYIDEDTFNGAESATYLIVTNESTGKRILYQATNIAGLSGRAHNSVCLNPEAADWRVTIDVSEFADGMYNLTLGLGYKTSGSRKTKYVVFPFEEKYAFTVVGGESISTVPITQE